MFVEIFHTRVFGAKNQLNRSDVSSRGTQMPRPRSHLTKLLFVLLSMFNGRRQLILIFRAEFANILAIEGHLVSLKSLS